MYSLAPAWIAATAARGLPGGERRHHVLDVVCYCAHRLVHVLALMSRFRSSYHFGQAASSCSELRMMETVSFGFLVGEFADLLRGFGVDLDLGDVDHLRGRGRPQQQP